MRSAWMVALAVGFGVTSMAVASDAPHADAHAEHGKAAESPAAKAAEAREHFFEALGDHMKAVGKFSKSQDALSPDIVAHAKAIAEASQHLPQHFPAGSGPESGVKTDAKAEIWSDAAGFAAAAKALQDESAKLVALVEAGDAAGAKAQAGAVGQSCGGCHQKYRVKHD